MTIKTETYKLRFERHLTAIETFLETQLPLQEPKILWKAMRHGVLNGGKRIRPVLLLETCRACGGAFEQALPVAAALEFIHCYSLIHDDLPCMDDDDMRRGQPTVHKAFSEPIAVLAGDALGGMAYGFITDLGQDIPAETRLKLISELSAAASVKGLVNGQVDDLQFMGSEPNEAILHRIHHGKTGALFRFPTRAGARLAGQSEEIIEQLGWFGQHLGLAFQIVDDILDIQAQSDVLGKTVGKDKEQGKITFPAVYGLDGTKAILKENIEQLHELLKGLEDHMDVHNMRFLVEFIERREA